MLTHPYLFQKKVMKFFEREPLLLKNGAMKLSMKLAKLESMLTLNWGVFRDLWEHQTDCFVSEDFSTHPHFWEDALFT